MTSGVPRPDPSNGLRVEFRTATIADEGTTSDIVNVIGRKVAGLYVPTMVSAALTFEVSRDRETFYDLYHLLVDDEASTAPLLAAVEVTIPAGTHNKAYAAPPALHGWPYFRIVAGAAQTAGPIAIEIAITD